MGTSTHGPPLIDSRNKFDVVSMHSKHRQHTRCTVLCSVDPIRVLARTSAIFSMFSLSTFTLRLQYSRPAAGVYCRQQKSTSVGPAQAAGCATECAALTEMCVRFSVRPHTRASRAAC